MGVVVITGANRGIGMAIAKGHIAALVNLGTFQVHGRGGLEADPAKGRRLFERGAAAGDPNGIYNLGLLYQNGVGEMMVLDFGNFKVRATMQRLEMGKRPDC